MKIKWSNGYSDACITADAVTITSSPNICHACSAQGDAQARPVARFDNSAREYDPINLCRWCLNALVMQLSESIGI